MALCKTIEDREYQKFVEVDGEHAVNVTGKFDGDFTPQGLTISGKHAEVLLSSSEWRELTAGITDPRNAINIQNNSAVEMKINHGTTAPTFGYIGMRLPKNAERQYAITASVKIWGRLASGADAVVDVEELA